MIIVIEKIVYPGKSLGRINGKVVFTDQGLPKETVETKIIKETKNYIQAKTTKIITVSPYRQKECCAHYQACSPYQYIDYPQQIEIKKQQIQEIICRQLNDGNNLLRFRQSPQIWGYRNKTTIKIIRENARPRLAYSLPKTIDKFVPIDKCFLLPQFTNLFMGEFIKLLAFKDFPAINQLTIKENKNHKLLISIHHNNSLNIKELSLALSHLTTKFQPAGIVLINQKEHSQSVIYGDNFLKEVINNKQFRIGNASFFQINLATLDLLIKDLMDNLTLNKNTILADLYCGVGTFGILLAERVKQVIGVEINPDNFSFLVHNTKLNNIKNFDLHLSDCDQSLQLLFKKNIDVIIVDPPRKGVGIKVCGELAAFAANTIVYISCNPSTLRRDLEVLLSAYKIQNIFAYDFFPHTPHIEIMVILSRKHTSAQ